MILDLMLPGPNGFDVLRRVMRKPFDLDEFVGEVIALLPAVLSHATVPPQQHVH